ncbi:E3 SUMO-protein ligase ZBED1-like isoform X2 [Hyla sarda]|uniref:E3 SUMO-protein ligase ZBED1-like isoform X2 n=1 Tax=Hyla sarda TaxID=327740 RepID=UPI0024C3F2E0|nr:E3 SUMO-protein ligase ZBED1-like isoform X2 [Hyla sarda]
MAGNEKEIRDAPGSYKAGIWTHFGFYNKPGSKEYDKSHAVCKICEARIKYCGNTTNLRAHMARHHGDIEVNLKQAASTTTPASQRTLDQANTAKFPPGSIRATRITQSVLYFICKNLRPLSVVENEGFQIMVNEMEPRYAIPSRQHITDIALPKMYKDVKKVVLEELSSAGRVALTCDAWTSRCTESYVTITAHHITGEWKLVSHVLQTRATYDSHTGENIAGLLRGALDEWGLTAKDPVVVTDNAANMAVAARLAQVSHIQCFAHSLNLASQKALKLPSVARLLGRIRRVTGFFRRSAIASHQLNLKQDQLQLPKHRLITDVVTRWNSSYDMTERFLEQQPAICAALLSNEVRKNEKDIFTLTESDITCAEEVLKALKPMKDATLVMSEESMPTLSLIAPLHAKLIMGTERSPDDSDTVKDIKEAIAQDLKKRYANEKETLYMASAVDPRFKNLPFLPADEADDIYARLTEAVEVEIQKLTTTSTMQEEEEDKEDNQPATNIQPPMKKPRASCALAELLGQTFSFDKHHRAQKSAHDVAATEVRMFRDETPLPLSDDPLDWWRKHIAEYPHIGRVAKCFLCIPGTSVSAERVFSTAGDIVSAQRSVLKAGHVDQLVFLNKNLKMKKK